MQEQEIIHYLKLLGEELKELQLQHPIRLLMIGGAYYDNPIWQQSIY